ncbi:MAG: hypothetical protein BWY75_01149 [bacterium ADurb.Bin425]|nr:MAG: hypothetical protein BWY75_01149 [bacterium ADurb.Bin425]
MIRITMCRDRDGEHFDQGSREEQPLQALRTMVEAELAFGGNITEATGTRITIVTRVFSCVDTSVFEGSLEEMQPLNQAVYYYLQACERQDEVMQGILADLARLPNGQGGSPLIISMAAPMLIGQNRLCRSSMLALGITDEHDLAAGQLLGLRNLFAAIELMQETGMSLAAVSAAVAT